ncbi:MAG: EAL domain-containing protein [Deltaproteobacteria bacterium]|nr:EAL domain-containing protein [Deltaproteobacteria bacterium]
MTHKRLTWTLTGDDDYAELDDEAANAVRGIGAEDLSVVYQPIVDGRSKKTEAVEVLTRCSVRRYQNPAILFEDAARARFAGRLGRLVREKAFAATIDTPVYLNVHPAELTARWLVRPDDPMYLHPHGVFLELTEAAAFEHHDIVVAVLGELSSRDVKLVIDDFGAGYSNLARLADLEPAVVKLDRSLVTQLHLRSRARNLVKHTIAMMHSFAARVVVEGVETVDELKAALDCGADLIQGYLLARPDNPVPRMTWPPA